MRTDLAERDRRPVATGQLAGQLLVDVGAQRRVPRPPLPRVHVHRRPGQKSQDITLAINAVSGVAQMLYKVCHI